VESNQNQQNLSNAYSDSMLTGGAHSTVPVSTQVAPSQQFQSPSLDVVYWIIKILKYWYLLLIGLVLAVGIAFVKNKSWFPAYRSATTILIQEDRKSTFGMTPFGSSISSNNSNQMIMYKSYDLIARAVDQLNVTNELFIKGRFKSTVLYNSGPITLESNFIAPGAYGLEFKITGIDDDTYQVSNESEDKKLSFKITGEYGKYLQHSLFFILVNKTDFFTEKYDLHFRFVSKDASISDYLSRLHVQLFMEGSSVIEASLIGPVAERDVDFLNILNQEFFTDNLMRKNESSQKTLNFIEEQLMVLRDTIAASEARLNAYQMRTGLYTSDKSTKAYSEIDDIDKRKVELRLRKQFLNDLDGYLKRNTTDILATPSSMGVTDGQLNDLVTQYNSLIFSLQTLKPENPIYRRYMMQVRDTRTVLGQEIQSSLRTLRVEERSLEERSGKLMGEMASLPERERQLLSHERDFKVNDSYNTYLIQRRIESQIQMASNAPDNLVLNQPRITSIVNGGETRQTYVTYILIVLALYIVFVVCKELIFNFKVQSRDEIEKLGLPVLGTIERSNKKALMMVQLYPKSGFSEGFRNLRARMEYITRKESPISILITSTEPKDGKTFIACNLASIYQFTGKKTIIVDFDLRRPAMSKSLEVGNEKGLSNYLVGQVDLEDIIISHPKYGFDIISAGTIPPNPSELIRSDKTVDLLEKLNKMYDYVILDCSPVGLVSDAHFLSRHVDALLYVVRNEKTNRSFLKYTVKELQEDQVANMVFVYNDVNLRSGYSGYGNKRYYGRSSYYVKHDAYYHNDNLNS